jgi:hypothetical protein
VVQEKVVSSYALVHETSRAGNDYLMEELKIVPDKLAVEDKYVVYCPVDQPCQTQLVQRTTSAL